MKKISINWFFTIFIALLFLFLWSIKAKQIGHAFSNRPYDNNILYEILGYILSLFWTIPAFITNILYKKELTKPIKIVTLIVAISSVVLTISFIFIPYFSFIAIVSFITFAVFLFSWLLFPVYYLLTIFFIKYKIKRLKTI